MRHQEQQSDKYEGEKIF